MVSKNIVVKNGVKTFSRWTVLDVPYKTVNFVRSYADRKGISIGRALEELIDNASVNSKKKEVIVLDYWQTISHFREYFKEFAEQMLSAGHEVHIVTAVGEPRVSQVFNDIDKTGVPYTEKHMVVFETPDQSPELKLKKCLEINATVIYDDRDDVCRLLNKNGIVAMRVTRKDNSTYDLKAEQK